MADRRSLADLPLEQLVRVQARIISALAGRVMDLEHAAAMERFGRLGPLAPPPTRGCEVSLLEGEVDGAASVGLAWEGRRLLVVLDLDDVRVEARLRGLRGATVIAIRGEGDGGGR